MSSSTQLSEAFGLEISRLVPTLYDFFHEATKAYGNRIALVCMHQPASFLLPITHGSRPPTSSSPTEPEQQQYLRWTFNQLSNAGHALAASLATAGIKPGMRIVAFVNNGVEWHIMLRAALELNCLFAPLIPKMALNKEEARHMMAMLQPNVLLLQDSNIAEKLELNAPDSFAQAQIKLFSNGGQEKNAVPQGWQDLALFVNSSVNDNLLQALDITRKADDVVFFLTTSGTTSLPKGCPYTNYMTASSVIAFMDHCEIARDPNRVSLCHSPTSHLMGGVAYTMAFHLSGLKVVHPSATFNPETSLSAIHLERCSDVPGVPPLISAMLSSPSFAKTDTSCLKHVHLGAMAILPEALKMAMHDFGAERASEGYAMTETGLAITHPFPSLKGEVPEVMSAGSISPGLGVRVCDPETGKPVLRGEPGECHVGGDRIIREYWLGPTERGHDDFYEDDYGLWIKTGDQAVMHENGELQIVGRYKDMIIRAGENIAPSAIESIIFSRFNLTTEIVGVPDEIAGEVPVAVMRLRTGQEIDAAKIKEMLVMELGSAWVPDYFVDVKDLGMDDFPRGVTGKVQKVKLRKLVVEKQEKEVEPSSGPVGNNIEILTRIWTKLLKVGPATLTPQTSIHDWADSLIIARFSTIFMNKTGVLFSLKELLDNPTIEAQAKLMESRRNGEGNAEEIGGFEVEREGPPGIGDMAHIGGDEEKFVKTKDIATSTLASIGYVHIPGFPRWPKAGRVSRQNTTLQLEWKDAEDTIPLSHFQGHLLTYRGYRRPQSQNHRHAFVCHGSSVTHVQQALEKLLTHHAILRTMAMTYDDETPLLITVRPSQSLFSKTILQLPNIEKAEDLATLKYGDPELDHVTCPGLMLRCIVVYIEETQCAGIIYFISHALFDGASLIMFLDDLEEILLDTIGTGKLKPIIPFKAWADSYHNLQTSPQAQASVAWQVSRLRGISKNPDALFPARRVPGNFKGNSTGWVDPAGTLQPPRKKLTLNDQGLKGVSRLINMPDLQNLKIKHNIDAAQILRAALAVMTVRHTKQSFAIFSQGQNGRTTWPFMPAWQADRMPSTMRVGGPTLQTAIITVAIKRDESILALLVRLQLDQEDTTRHQFAPWEQVIDRLNALSPGEGDWVADYLPFGRQFFNWLPTLPTTDYKALEKVQLESRMDAFLIWVGIPQSQTSVLLSSTWDDAQLYLEELRGMMDEIAELAESFAKCDNWERAVGDFF